MFSKTQQVKPHISDEIRAIASSDEDRRRLYDMDDSSAEFKVAGKTVRISTGGSNMKVVKIRR